MPLIIARKVFTLMPPAVPPDAPPMTITITSTHCATPGSECIDTNSNPKVRLCRTAVELSEIIAREATASMVPDVVANPMTHSTATAIR